jgi:hypothetical protein
VLRLVLGLLLTLLLRLDVARVKVKDLRVHHYLPRLDWQVCVVERPIEQLSGRWLVVLK